MFGKRGMGGRSDSLTNEKGKKEDIGGKRQKSPFPFAPITLIGTCWAGKRKRNWIRYFFFVEMGRNGGRSFPEKEERWK